MLKNPIVIDGNTAFISMYHNGRLLTTMIDAADLPAVTSLTTTWSIANVQGRPYVRANVPHPYASCGHTTVYLHRFISGARRGERVHHLNQRTLDNTRANLVVESSIREAKTTVAA